MELTPLTPDSLRQYVLAQVRGTILADALQSLSEEDFEATFDLPKAEVLKHVERVKELLAGMLNLASACDCNPEALRSKPEFSALSREFLAVSNTLLGISKRAELIIFEQHDTAIPMRSAPRRPEDCDA